MSARSGHQNKAKNSPASASNTCHAWDVIIKYYKMKGGPEYNSAPARKLSMSFGLDLSGGGSTGNNNRQGSIHLWRQVILSYFWPTYPGQISSDLAWPTYLLQYLLMSDIVSSLQIYAGEIITPPKVVFFTIFVHWLVVQTSTNISKNTTAAPFIRCTWQ